MKHGKLNQQNKSNGRDANDVTKDRNKNDVTKEEKCNSGDFVFRISLSSDSSGNFNTYIYIYIYLCKLNVARAACIHRCYVTIRSPTTTPPAAGPRKEGEEEVQLGEPVEVRGRGGAGQRFQLQLQLVLDAGPEGGDGGEVAGKSRK